MFGLGATEMILIGLVALIVIGPKDLPNMFHTMGKASARVRMMAREFTQAMESAADEAGMKEVQKTMRDVSNPKAYGIDKIREATRLDTGTTKTNTAKSSAAKADGTPKPEPKVEDADSETAALRKERAEFRERMDARAGEIVKAREEAAAQTPVEPDMPVRITDAKVADKS